jgi:Ca2+-binding RTX toxin-like protein
LTDTGDGIFYISDTAAQDASSSLLNPHIVGSDFANVLTGDDQANVLSGGAGNDTLMGGAGNDTLIGGVGIDSLSGGAGNDTLIGGVGNDTLTGGLGVDVFQWSLGDQGVSGTPAIDHLTDFSKVEGDTLNLADLLQGESSGNLSQYLTFGTETFGTTTHAVLNVSTEAGGPVVQQVVFDNYADVAALQAAFAATSSDQLIANMKANNNLITD